MTRAALLTLLATLTACGGGRAPAPEPGTSQGQVPNLQGRTVMVLPAQEVLGLAGNADAEIAFALKDRGGERIRWVLPEDMRHTLARSPGTPTRIDGLPVGIFLRAQVDRVGDPLYGHLRRLAALTGAELALIPVQVRRDSGAGSATSPAEIAAALIQPRNGRVYWFGVVEGEPGGPRDPRTLASAADALARALIW